jgi:hypothetical protein
VVLERGGNLVIHDVTTKFMHIQLPTNEWNILKGLRSNGLSNLNAIIDLPQKI